MSFHVGQLVECIDDSMPPGSTRRESAQYPIVGHVYTVRDVVPDGLITLLRLAEIDNSHLKSAIGEPGFGSDHFRPLTEQRLAIFRRLLAPIPKQTVDA